MSPAKRYMKKRTKARQCRAFTPASASPVTVSRRSRLPWPWSRPSMCLSVPDNLVAEIEGRLRS